MALEKGYPQRFWIIAYTKLRICCHCYSWDIVLCNVVEYKWNTDSCDSYLHVIMTLSPTPLLLCPYGLMLSFALSRPVSSMVGFWQLLLFSFVNHFDDHYTGIWLTFLHNYPLLALHTNIFGCWFYLFGLL